MTLFTELPPEIVEQILALVNPRDLASVPLVCRALYFVVTNNKPLFRAVYISNLDLPPAHLRDELNWEKLLKDSVRLQTICRRKRVNDKKQELPFVYETASALIRNASPDGPRASISATHPTSLNAQLLASIFADETNQAAFLCRSRIYQRARAELIYKSNGTTSNYTGDNLSWSDHMRSAKLHCLYGKPIQFAHPEAHRTRHSRMRPFACSRVYDLRQYTPESQWGPFMQDDDSGQLRIDWEMVEAIMIILGSNLRNLGLEAYPIYKNFWATPFAGVWPDSYMELSLVEEASEHPHPPCVNCSRRLSFPLEDEPPGDDADADVEDENDDDDDGGEGSRAAKKRKVLDDPYGINGTWLRVVCFLDYTDFFAYNFSNQQSPLPADVPRPVIDVGEATRLILMKIAVSHIEEPSAEDGQELPVVHFKGTSRSLDDSWDENANSDLAGSVRLTKEGEVRWTTVSIFGGVERWKSESVQIGGVKSARGVLGNWFDRDYDVRGPVGPTAFWKISDRIARNKHEQRVMLSSFLPIMDAAMDDEYEPGSEDEDEDLDLDDDDYDDGEDQGEEEEEEDQDEDEDENENENEDENEGEDQDSEMDTGDERERLGSGLNVHAVGVQHGATSEVLFLARLPDLEPTYLPDI